MCVSVWEEWGIYARGQNPYLPHWEVNKYYLKFKNQGVAKYVL